MLRAALLGLMIVGATDAAGQIRLSGEFSPPLEAVEGGSEFGASVAALEDLNGDGVGDLAVGAPADNQAYPSAGAVWILFMNQDGSVLSTHKISEATDSITGPADQFRLGTRLSGLGDWRGRGFYELAIGRSLGAVVGLRTNGMVEFQESFPEADSRQSILVLMGDIDGNGFNDLAESRHNSTTGDVKTILYTSPDSWRAPVRIGQGFGGMPASALTFNDRFSASITNIGDLNGDGRDELVCGTPGDDDYFDESGAVYVLFLTDAGMVSSFQKISNLEGNLGADLQSGDLFGTSVANVGDLDGDGLNELAVGSPGRGAGSVWILFLNADGSVQTEFEIKAADYGLPEPGTPEEAFGSSISLVEDYSGNGIPDLAVGIPYLDAVWLLPALAEIPASVQFEPPDPTASVGRSVPVSLQPRSVGGTSSVDINFRQGGADRYLSTEMAKEGDTYSYAIPPFVGSSRGLEYHVTVTNAAGVESRLPREGFISIPLTVPEGLLLNVPSGNSATGYRIVSVPLEYEGVSLLDVLKQSLGERDIGVWRAFGLSNGVAVDFDDARTSAGSGSAIWLLHSEPGRVLRTGPGKSIPTDRLFKIPLNRDWNLIGNPYDFEVPVDALSTSLGHEIEMLAYDGDWRVEGNVLKPRQGYAVFSTQLDTLIFDPTRRESTSKRSRSSATRSLSWSVQVRATDGLARDFSNTFGAADFAVSGWDSFDAPEPPAVGEYVAAYFVGDEPGSPAEKLRTDIRPTLGERDTWRLEVVSAMQQRVTLSFEHVETLPRDLDILLFDPVVGRTQDLRTLPEYTLVGGSPDAPRELLIHVGHDLSAEGLPGIVPIHNGLESFPNPFSGAVTIRFDVPSPAISSLRIYDVTGRKVTDLLSDERTEPGMHAVVWDGRDVHGRYLASGMYLLKLESGEIERSIALSVTR